MQSTIALVGKLRSCNDFNPSMQKTQHALAGTTLGNPFPVGSFATFMAVHDTGTVSGAAERLHLSQSAVSRRLQGLEDQLGVVLFERLPACLQLTAAGRALLPHAQRALAAEADAVRAVTEQSGQIAGSLALAVVGSLVELYLTDALRVVVEEYPRLDIEITTASSMQVRELVRRGDVDFGISYAQPTDETLTVETLLLERLIVVGAPNHVAMRERLRRRDLCKHRWLVFPDHGPQTETAGSIARRTLERYRVPAHYLRPIDSLSAQRALASAGYGLAFLPTSMVAADLRDGRLVEVIAPSLTVSAPVTIAARRYAHTTPAAAMLRALLGEVGRTRGQSRPDR